MLLRAAEELRIDPHRSYMVGDTLKDIEAGVQGRGAGRSSSGPDTAEEAAAALDPD